MIGIIDYGMGNIQSVRNAFERVGAEVRVVAQGHELAACDGLVLPGVGAFSMAMVNLHKNDIVAPLKDMVAAGTPLLGICLGLQLLADASEEFGAHQGLGLIPGRVRRIPVTGDLRLPHIGWNGLRIRPEVDGGLFDEVPQDSAVYFVHSFMFDCDPRYVSATTDYGGEVTAAVCRDNIQAVQFHPEKSQTQGLRLLRNFNRTVQVRREKAAHA
jgi:glutamine amidotransferase